MTAPCRAEPAALAAEAAACRALWRAVLLTGLADAARGEGTARAWLDSRDFGLVCELAGEEPAALRRHRIAAIERKPAARRRDAR